MPTVSVLIPTYEPKPDHLKAAIESVLAQTFTDWELIIHDDASKSDVEAIVRPFLTDPRIHFIRSPRNLGIGGNWNATMRRRGDSRIAPTTSFVAFIFQDDLWHPDYLKQAVEVLERNQNVGFVAANHAYRMEGHTAAMDTGIYKEVTDLRNAVMKDGRIHREEFLRAWIDRGLRPNLIGEPSFVVLRRSLMEAVGPFLENMRQGLDVEYWIRCLLQSDGWWIAEKLGEFRVHASGATAKNEESGAGQSDRLRTFRILINTLPDGPIKALAKRARRREFFGMVTKFVKRKLHFPK